MPRIPQDYLDCVGYLNLPEEEGGSSSGATAFFVRLEDSQLGHPRIYVVSNSHVARKTTVLRVHRQNEIGYLDVDPAVWVHHPAGDDVAAFRLVVDEPCNVPSVPGNGFVTEKIIREYGVRPGMAACMIGRLVDQDRDEQRNPVVRFGHLAMMPGMVKRDHGAGQLSFLVEMLSLDGYSGSPVFIYEVPYYFPGDCDLRLRAPYLLGINWGCHRNSERLRSKGSNGWSETSFWLSGNSGFAAVVPSWKISEVLDAVDQKGESALISRPDFRLWCTPSRE